MKKQALAVLALVIGVGKLGAGVTSLASEGLLWKSVHRSTELEKDLEWLEEALSVTSVDLIDDITTDPDEEGIEIIDSTIVDEGMGTPEDPEEAEAPEASDEIPEATTPEEVEVPEAPVEETETPDADSITIDDEAEDVEMPSQEG